MGSELLKYFEKVQAKAGIKGAVKMAMITKMSKSDAKAAPDSPENLKLFEEALAKINWVFTQFFIFNIYF